MLRWQEGHWPGVMEPELSFWEWSPNVLSLGPVAFGLTRVQGPMFPCGSRTSESKYSPHLAFDTTPMFCPAVLSILFPGLRDSWSLTFGATLASSLAYIQCSVSISGNNATLI